MTDKKKKKFFRCDHNKYTIGFLLKIGKLKIKSRNLSEDNKENEDVLMEE